MLFFGRLFSEDYTGYAGWHVTAGNAVKFGTTHDRSRPEVGSGFRIDAYGRKRVSSFSRNFDTSQQKKTPLQTF